MYQMFTKTTAVPGSIRTRTRVWAAIHFMGFASRLFAIIAAVALQVGVTPAAEPPDEAPKAAPSVADTDLSQAAAQADFDLMRSLLEEAHSGLYRYSTRAEMDRVFEVQRAKLSHPVKKAAFMELIAETLATIRCGHTSYEPEDAMQKEVLKLPLFPLRVLLQEKKLLVLLNDTAANETIRPGMEILEINGHKASEVVERLYRAEPGDGDITTGKAVRISAQFGPLYRWYVDEATEFKVRVCPANRPGESATATLKGVSRAERDRNHNPVNQEVLAGIRKLNWSRENAALRFLREPEVAEIRLRTFNGDDLPRWFGQTFKSLTEKGTKTVILDLRGNGGGKDENGAALVSCLADKPFRYFDRINVKTITLSDTFKQHSDWSAPFEDRLRGGTVRDKSGGYLITPALHPCVAEQAPGKYPFRGKVIVLIDGGTFSTAADFCAVTRYLKRVVFVGEETGGGYCGNNSGPDPKVTLPHSQLRVRVPMYEYWNAVDGGHVQRRGIIPDYPIETSIVNLARGEDAQLDFAQRLAESASAANAHAK